MTLTKIYPGIDWPKFGLAVKACCDAAGSYRDLVKLHEGMNVTMVSRAVNANAAHPLSAANFLHLCACLKLDVWHFYGAPPRETPRFKKGQSFKDIVKNQTVSANVSREMFMKGRSFAKGSLPPEAADGQSAFDESETRGNYHKARSLP